MSLSIFSATHKNLINPFLSTTGNVRMELEHLIHGENCSKTLLGIREIPEIKGCFACPLRGSCLAPLWSPPHHAGISLKRGIYNKTWQNGGNMIDSSVWLRPAVIMWNICSCLVCSSALQCNYLWAWLQWDLWKAKYYRGFDYSLRTLQMLQQIATAAKRAFHKGCLTHVLLARNSPAMRRCS